MASKCGKCSVSFDNPKDINCIGQCSECKEYYHSACCTAQAWSVWSKSRAKKSWKCDGCKTESASSHSDASGSSIMAVLQEIRKDMADSRRESGERFDGLENSMSAIRAAMEESRGRIIQLEAETSKLKEENEQQRKEITANRNEAAKLRLEVLDLQQYSRRNNIEIKGIPTSHGEDVYAVLESIAKVIGVQWNRWDISIAHRIGRPASGYTAIIASFVSRSVREMWLSAAKQRRLDVSDISTRLTPGPVYINSHLTTHNKQLLGRAKRMVRDRRLGAAWAVDGKVLVRRLEGVAGIHVKAMEDLSKYDG